MSQFSQVQGTPNRLDNFMSCVEDGCTKVAFIPGVGLGRAALGTLQFVAAFVITIFAALPARLFGHKALLNHTATHMKHGIANMIGGIIDALPGVGVITFFIRKSKETTDSDGVVLRDPEARKFIPYESVQKAGLMPYSSEGLIQGQDSEYVSALTVKIYNYQEQHVDLYGKLTMRETIDLMPYSEYHPFAKESLAKVLGPEEGHVNEQVRDPINIFRDLKG